MSVLERVQSDATAALKSGCDGRELARAEISSGYAISPVALDVTVPAGTTMLVVQQPAPDGGTFPDYTLAVAVSP